MSEIEGQIRDMSIAPPQKCAICQATRNLHAELQEKGELHHQFSERGELVHVKPEPKRQRAIVAPDLVLRLALIDAGVITESQLTLAEAKIRAGISSGGRGSDRPDSGDRPAESS